MRNHWKKLALPLAAALAVACGPADDAGMAEDEPMAEEGAGEMAGEAETGEMAGEAMGGMDAWNVRLDDEGADPAGFAMAMADGGFTVETGPAGIAWRADDMLAEGDYTVSATFTEMGSPSDHREAYGLLVGGRDLDGPQQEYTYFLVRGDGSYLIKRRMGSDTETLVDWTSSDAVESVDVEGEEEPNALSARVTGAEVEFAVNGTVVETLPAEQVDPAGIAGVRVNHRLNVRVDDFMAEPADAGMAEGG